MRNGRLAVLSVLVLSAALGACSGGGSGDDSGGTFTVPAENAWVVTPVQAHGRLRVCEQTFLCGEEGEHVQLRGMSLFWSNTGWGAERFYNASLVEHLADQWNATVIRAAIGAQDGGDYTVDAAANLERARTVVDAAVARGMYVIVDWHSHGAGAASLATMTTQAQGFFGTLAEEYAGVPNLIWEPFNEPPGREYTGRPPWPRAHHNREKRR